MLGSRDLEKAILSFYDIDANPKTDLVIYQLLISYRRGSQPSIRNTQIHWCLVVYRL